MYGQEIFPEPYAFNYGKELVKIPGLQGGGKMSKSDGDNNVINLIDTPELIRKKMSRAITDTGPSEPNTAPSAPVQNLFDLMKIVSSEVKLSFYQQAYANCNIRYGDFKKDLAEDMVTFLKPVQEKIADINSNNELLRKVVKIGKEKASESADRTILQCREVIGFRGF
jgi:tryptophanyl-tRNA synthetase